MSQRSVIKSVLWSGGELPLWEICTLFRENTEFSLMGTVLGTLDHSVLEVRYRIRCGPDWKSKEVELDVRKNGEMHLFSLRVADGKWVRDKEEIPEFLGLTDVDISVTPSTNTLPIRRLSLPVGGTAETTAVWIKVPQFEIQRLPQRYTRLGERRYLYESDGGRFSAELDVDEFGLVKSYGKFWRVWEKR